MTLKEFNKEYKSKKSLKQKTRNFNGLSLKERKAFLESLSDEERKDFISKIRTQAVKDFWTHEQELIKQGKCTRDWTPEQIEDILHISEKTGTMSINGEAAVDLNGEKFIGHHMLNVAEHPEYAGDWRNIEALNYDEHFNGAHKGNLKVPTNAYYNPETGENIPVDESRFEGNEDVKTGEGILSTKDCVFKSDKEVDSIYSQHGTIKDGERLALKNVELAKSPTGNVSDIDRAVDVSKRYKCENLFDKFKINKENILAAIKGRGGKMSLKAMKNRIGKERLNNVKGMKVPEVKVKLPKVELSR